MSRAAANPAAVTTGLRPTGDTHASPHEGTVSRARDPSGRWRGRVMVHGRVYTVSSTKSRADCRRLLNAKRAEVLHPDFVPPPTRAQRAAVAAATTPPAVPTGSPAPVPAPAGPLTVAAYLTAWLETKRRLARAPATLVSYAQIVRRWLIPRLGDRVVAELRPEDVEALFAWLEAEGLARSTVRLVHRVLRVALNDGSRTQRITVSAAVLAVRGPSVRRARHAWPTPDDLARLVEVAATDERFGAAIVLAAYSGLRIGEILGLAVDDVDLTAGVVTLTRQLGPDGRRAPLKTDASRRQLTIESDARAALERHLAWRARCREAAGAGWRDREGLLFTTAEGAPLYPAALRRALSAALTAAGVPTVRFHALRHGHAMALRRAGVDLETIRDRLGHTDLATTSGFYFHRDPTLDADASARFGRLIDERRAARRGQASGG